MGLERLGAVELKPAELPRERGGSKGGGFPALMDSVLAGSSERTKPEPVGTKSSADSADRRDGRRALEGEGRGDERRSAARTAAKAESRRSERSASKSESASDSQATETGADASLASESANEKLAARDESKPDAEADGETIATEAEAAELLAAANAPAWTPAAAAAVPELEGTATAETVGVDALRGERALDAGIPASGDIPSAARSGADASSAYREVVEPAEIVNAPATIADAGGREAARSVLAALESAGVKAAETKTAEANPGVTVNEAPDAQAETLVARARSESGEARADANRLEARRVERLDVAARVAEVASRSLITRSGPGSDSASADAQRDGASVPALVLEAPDAEAPSPSPAAATPPPSTLVEASLRSAAEGVAQGRADASAIANPNRAPELPPVPQSDRPQPAAAPDAIAIQADWLATRGGGSARLVLHPPELGEIAIRVTVRQQSVGVVMVAQTALAHAMAEEQGDRLAQAFSHRDLRLDQFEVRRGDPGDSSSTGQFGSSDAGARERERAGEGRDGESGRRASGAGGARERAGERAPVGLPPRIVTTGHATGIDLRI